MMGNSLWPTKLHSKLFISTNMPKYETCKTSQRSQTSQTSNTRETSDTHGASMARVTVRPVNKYGT
jgi:hypothetical protein